jgi:hypothetical protein
VDFIVHSGGMNDMDRILDRLAAGDAPEAAVHAVLHSDYAELARDTVDFLQKTYRN